MMNPLKKPVDGPSAKETVDLAIWFVCSLEVRPEFLLGKGTIAQEHGRAYEVRLNGVPATEFVTGRPNGSVIEYAEREFLSRVDALFPEHHIIGWETRLGSPTGAALSRYEVYLR
jgi:hypothetical protein